jgi:hypothetical protein
MPNNNVIECLVNPLVCKLANHQNFTNNSNNGNNVNEIRIEDFTMEIFITIVLILIIQVLPIVLIAVHCNPKRPITFGIIAFIFPGVYLFQHTIRKYVMAEKGYCGN